MSGQLDETTQSLREMILAGTYRPEGKLRELTLADDLSVSRTVIRLALGELEKEGLVYRLPNRGFRVRSFTLTEVRHAILVRGELEGMAARLCAEHGISGPERQDFETAIAQMDELLRLGLSSLESRARWIDLNAAFHERIVQACGNRVVGETIAHLSRIPLVSARALVFDQSDVQKSLHRMQDAHQDHKTVFDAIVNPPRRKGGKLHARACDEKRGKQALEFRCHAPCRPRAGPAGPVPGQG